MEGRRSGNYVPSIWKDDYVQSLTSPYSAKECLGHLEELKDQVKIIMKETDEDEEDQLELIDNLRRLDISYHFQDEIGKILENIYMTNPHLHDDKTEKDLYTTSLKFRLLRQQGYHVPQDVFSSFMDAGGNFQTSILDDDVKGVLALYEASFLSVENESIMDKARDFATHHLKENLARIITDDIESEEAHEIKHALELPMHWRVQKLEAKWFIHIYDKKIDANRILLELAKLDFNITQAKYQNEVKEMSRWYRESGLIEKLSFARDRLVECFLWALGFIPDTHFAYARKILTKIAVFITIIDDIYDVYGTVDELELFTNAIERWDVKELDKLSEYMKICFLGLFNCTNELAYDILRDQGLNVISNLRKLWTELSRTYYQEAKWYHTGYYPTLNEYLNTAWISITGPLLLLHGYVSITNPINTEDMQSLAKYPSIIRWPSMVLRLVDDLGTTSDEIKRGDVPKSIQCYMNDNGSSEEEARKHVKHLIDVTLKRMNKDILMDSPLRNFVPTAMNLARISLCFYEHGDGFGTPQYETKEKLVSLIVEPILL